MVLVQHWSLLNRRAFAELLARLGQRACSDALAAGVPCLACLGQQVRV